MFTEKEIQKHIWNHREDWTELIDEASFPAEHIFSDDLSDLSPENLIGNQIFKRLKSIDSFIRYAKLIGCEVPLEKSSEPSIRLDLLGIHPETSGMLLCELKKVGSHTEREAFSELLGYSGHFQALFPSLNKEDLYLLLIAPMKTRIIREAFINTLLFDRKPVYALIPYFTDEANINTLRLKPWLPDSESIRTITRVAFQKQNFSVCKFVWENIPGEWNPQPGTQEIEEWAKERMNHVSALASQLMEARGIHGFTYSSQSWPELSQLLPYTNSLIIVGLNPYAVTNAVWQSQQDERNTNTLAPDEYCCNLTDVIPGLLSKNIGDVDQYNHLEELYLQWPASLFRIGRDIVKATLQNTNGQTIYSEGTFFDRLDIYQKEFLEHVSCHNYEVRSTGFLRELFFDVTKLDYELINKHGISEHPFHSDMFSFAEEALGNHYLFMNFLSRMFDCEYIE